MNEQAVNITRVAEHLGIHPQTAYTHANAGTIPGFRVGRAWRFFLSEVDAKLSDGTDPWALPSKRR